MSEMVERAARAIAEDPTPGRWGRISEAVRETYRADARAAIRAMREPTPAMIEAAKVAAAVGDIVVTDDALATIWRAMIWGALEERP